MRHTKQEIDAYAAEAAQNGIAYQRGDATMVFNTATRRFVKITGRVGATVVREGQQAAARIAAEAARLAAITAVGLRPKADPHDMGAFRRQDYNWTTHTEKDYTYLTPERRAQLIYQTVQQTPNVHSFVLPFEDDRGDVIRRTIHLGRQLQGHPEQGPDPRNFVNTEAEILEAFQSLSDGRELYGSDPISAAFHYSPDYGFTITSILRPAGGARLTNVSGRKLTEELKSHRFFELQDLSADNNEYDCLFAVCRQVACAARKGTGVNIRNPTVSAVRKLLNTPKGPITASREVIATVASAYGLYIRIITDIVVLPDNERVYDDDAKTLQNRCISEPQLQIIAEGGNPAHPPCDIYMQYPPAEAPATPQPELTELEIFMQTPTAEEVAAAEAAPPKKLPTCHYLYIAGVKMPKMCKATGDMLENDKAFSQLYIRRRLKEQGREYYCPDEQKAAKDVARKLEIKKEKEKRAEIAVIAATIDKINNYRMGIDDEQLEHGETITNTTMDKVFQEQVRELGIKEGVLRSEISKAKKYAERLIIFDYETVYDSTATLFPYALGYIDIPVPDIANVDADSEVDYSTYSDRVVQSYTSNINAKRGRNSEEVNRSLVELIKYAPKNVRYTLISFNGARFDNFLLAHAVHNAGLLTSVFASSQGLRSISLGRHRSLDLAKLLPGTSLDNACESFKTMPKKEKGFSHVVVQRAYECGKFHEWVADNETKMKAYLTGDVLSTLSLLMKYRFAEFKLSNTDILHYKAPQTVGGLSWAQAKRTCNFPRAVRKEADDLFIRSAIVGGRVQVYTESREPITDEMRMVDFTSLYPTVMAVVPKVAALFEAFMGFGLYPTSESSEEIVWIAGRDEYIPNVTGIYDVTVKKQPPNLPNVLPKRLEDGRLDWKFRGEFNTRCTHFDINLIRKYGGEVDVHYGLIWENTSTELFQPYILPLAAKKDEQDSFKANKDPRYNPALRELEKLKQNAISGKLCQENFDEIVKMAQGIKAQLAAENSMNPKEPINWFPIGGETCILVGKKKAGTVYNPIRAKPSFIAVLIYSYSRGLVYRTLCQHNILYSDTDSGLFRLADYKNLMAAFPSLDFAAAGRKKALGDLEEELVKDPKNPPTRFAAYLNAPKDYAVFTWTAAGEFSSGSKLRVKGVNQRSDRLICATAPEGAADMVVGFDTDTEPEASEQHTARAINKTKEICRLTETYHTDDQTMSKPLSDPVILEEFFRRRLAGETCFVFCSQLTRSYKTAYDGSTISGFQLRQRFLVKSFCGCAGASCDKCKL